MFRVLSVFAVSALLFSFSRPRTVSEEERMLREIIKLRESFVATGFAADLTQERNTTWTKFSCPEPPVVSMSSGLKELVADINRFDGLDPDQTGLTEMLVEKYPNTAYFKNRDVFNVAVLFCGIGKQRIIAPFTGEAGDAEKVNRVIAFLKKNGKRTGNKEYYYLNNYFRLGGMMTNDVEDQGFYMLEKKFYPDGFKNYLIVRAK